MNSAWQEDWEFFRRFAILAVYILVLYLLYVLRGVLLLGFLGILLGLLWHALALGLVRLTRGRIRHAPAVGLVVAASLLLVAGLLRFTAEPVLHQFHSFMAALPGLLSATSRRLAPLLEAVPGGPRWEPAQIDTAALATRIVSSGLAIVRSGVVGLAEAGAAVLIGVFLAWTPERYRDALLALLPRELAPGARRLIDALTRTLLAWMKGSGLAMLAVGLMVTLILRIAGLEYYLLFGIMAGVFNIVPYLGPVLAFIGPSVIALSVSPAKFAAILVAYIVAQNLESNVIVPYFMSRMAYIPPALTIFGLYAMAELFGFLGILLAVPILACLLTLIRFAYATWNGGEADTVDPQ